jgi:betaine-aldehyde dehydrogenase
VTVHDTLFLDNTWVAPAGTGTIDVISPATEKVIATVPDGTRADIDRAVAGARAAFDHGDWPALSAAERADLMSALSAALQARCDELARTITSENGSPISWSLLGQVFAATMALDYYAGLAREYVFEDARDGLMGPALVRREPVGVVGAIVPWNVPLFTSMLKLGPALAAGCTVVLKPAPETPLDAYLLAECIVAAGFPPGVVNIVAAGRDVGEHLVTHPDVDKVAFTGSTAAGRRIGALCGERLRRVTLELGGKSAAIVLDDADIGSTVEGLVPAAMMNNGQACVAQTRILVPRSRAGELAGALVEAVRGVNVGDPFDPATGIGPLVASRQRDRVEGYIATGTREGATIATGGGRPRGLDRGWYVEPTVFTDVDNTMTIAREEIFGPVVAVIAYDDEDDAVALANDSDYGLAGTVWSADTDRAIDVARRVQTGTLSINGFTLDFNCPFGGRKASGLGRELGPEGLEAYLEAKTISRPTGTIPLGG